MTVQGLDSLSKKLKRMPKEAEDAMIPVMIDIAKQVVALAKKLVPVDDGDLRDSINWTWGEVPKGSIVLGKVMRSRRGNITISIYAGDERAFYARWVEFGTASHGLAKGAGNAGFKGGGPTHPGSPARPFFYPSWRANSKQARSKMSRAINKSVKAAIAKG